jgi:hypothetical protein
VRDFFGAFAHDGRAANAYLVTTSTFSDAEGRWAEGKPVALMEGAVRHRRASHYTL